MQLRVARFCLDCEELHTDNTCPRCASESYVFLSSWLKVEERRRWKRSKAKSNEDRGGSGPGIADTLTRWVKGQSPDEGEGHPTTRAADHVVHFDTEGTTEPDKPARKTQPSGTLGKVRT